MTFPPSVKLWYLFPQHRRTKCSPMKIIGVAKRGSYLVTNFRVKPQYAEDRRCLQPNSCVDQSELRHKRLRQIYRQSKDCKHFIRFYIQLVSFPHIFSIFPYIFFLILLFLVCVPNVLYIFSVHFDTTPAHSLRDIWAIQITL